MLFRVTKTGLKCGVALNLENFMMPSSLEAAVMDLAQLTI